MQWLPTLNNCSPIFNIQDIILQGWYFSFGQLTYILEGCKKCVVISPSWLSKRTFVGHLCQWKHCCNNITSFSMWKKYTDPKIQLMTLTNKWEYMETYILEFHWNINMDADMSSGCQGRWLMQNLWVVDPGLTPVYSKKLI